MSLMLNKMVQEKTTESLMSRLTEPSHKFLGWGNASALTDKILCNNHSGVMLRSVLLAYY